MRGWPRLGASAEGGPVQGRSKVIHFWRSGGEYLPTCLKCVGAQELLEQRPLRPDASPEGARQEALFYDRLAFQEGHPRRILTNGLSDFWDGGDGFEWTRVLALDTMRETPHLKWLLLTRKPASILERLRSALVHASQRCIRKEAGKPRDPEALSLWLRAWLEGSPPPNISLGTTTAEPGTPALRVMDLLGVPAVGHFLCCDLGCPRELAGLSVPCRPLSPAVSALFPAQGQA